MRKWDILPAIIIYSFLYSVNGNNFYSVTTSLSRYKRMIPISNKTISYLLFCSIAEFLLIHLFFVCLQTHSSLYRYNNLCNLIRNPFRLYSMYRHILPTTYSHNKNVWFSLIPLNQHYSLEMRFCPF